MGGVGYIESAQADRWIYSALTGDAPLVTLLGGPKVYSDVIPPSVTLPAIVFSFVSSDDLGTMNARRVWADANYNVKVIGNGQGQGTNFIALEPIGKRMDALLHRASATVAGGKVLFSQRTALIRYTEITDGTVYCHLGLTIRLYLQGA